MRLVRLVGAICSLVVLPLSNADEQNPYLDEIIVTAEYVEKSVQDSAIAVTAIDNDMIERLGIGDVDDLMIFVPSLSRDLLDLTIRGVGRNFRALGGDVGVPVYYNGIYQEEAIAVGNENAYYDLNRIEVLRGPQGTLYGRNAIGGVINYVSNAPTREFFAEVKTRVGAYDTADFQGVISGPLIDNMINYRISTVSVNQGADRPSRAAPGEQPISDTGDFEDNNLTVSLEITPTDNLDILLYGSTRYYRVVPRASLLVGEGADDRTRRSSELCFPEGSDCFVNPIADFYNRPPLNPNANNNLPINGDGFGDDLDNEAFPDFKPDYGYRYTRFSADTQWHLGYGQHTLRLLTGFQRIGWTAFERHYNSAPGGRNSCASPLCPPGTRGEQISRYRAIGSNPLRQHSAELQLITNYDGPFNFVAGLFYLDVERELEYEQADDAQLGLYTDAPQWGLLNPTDFFPAPRGIGRHELGGNDVFEFNHFGGTTNGNWFWMDTEIQTRALAAYIQTSYELSEQWSLSAGIRWSQDRKVGREFRWIYSEINAEFFGFSSLEEFNELITTDPDSGMYNGDPFRLAGFPVEIIDSLRIEDDWDKLTWQAALSWRPNRRTLAYGSITTGYRSGGFNLGLHQEFPYEEESIISYEIGLKTDLLDNRLRLNTSVYFYDYEDHQVSATAPIPASVIGCNIGCFAPTNEQFTFINGVQNVPKATNYGAELEAIWAISPLLTTGLIYSYMETEITSDFFVTRDQNEWSAFTSSESVNLNGGELNRAPRNKFTLWANYQLLLGDRGRINLLASFGYTDEQYFNVLNDRINEAPSHLRWDFRATWESEAGKYRVSAFVKNITNELGIVELRPGENFTRNADTTKPRIWGIEFRARFGNWSQSGLDQIDGPNVSR